MSEISATAVKSLRDRTGAGMMDCKKALEETGGDEERAIDLLRKQGAAQAARRSDREAEEGVVRVAEADGAGAVAMVEVTSETDFVARNDEFQAFAERAAEVARDAALAEGEVRPGEELLDLPEDAPLRKELNGLRAKIGENLQLRRWIRLEPGDDARIGSYIHFGSKIGVLVELSGLDPADDGSELVRDVAMHVAAAAPAGVSREDIPEEDRERERKVLREQAEEEGKPPEIVEKIVEGRMRKFYEESTLLEQGFVKDPDRSVGDLLGDAGSDVTVRRFVRFEIGD